MCFPKRKLKRSSKKMRYSKPQNILTGCKMVILFDDAPYSKFYRPDYCNAEIVEDGLCEVHKDIKFIEK